MMGFLSHRNQYINLQDKPINWFLHDMDLRHERVQAFKSFPDLEPFGSHSQYQQVLTFYYLYPTNI